jgi:hypothetical protein
MTIEIQEPLSNLGVAPFFIVVAERRGIFADEQLSLAHCMDYIWLKAIAMGLDFQPLSMTAQMAQDRGFCELIGIPFEEFSFDGCLIGHSSGARHPSSKPTTEV